MRNPGREQVRHAMPLPDPQRRAREPAPAFCRTAHDAPAPHGLPVATSVRTFGPTFFLPESSSAFRGAPERQAHGLSKARKVSRDILRASFDRRLEDHRHILRAARLDIYLVITKNLCRQDLQPSRECSHDVHGTSHAPAAGSPFPAPARHPGLHLQ